MVRSQFIKDYENYNTAVSTLLNLLENGFGDTKPLLVILNVIVDGLRR